MTGARSQVSTELPDLVKRIKGFTNVPLAVGFGVATREHFINVAAHAEGVVIGSKIISVLKNAAAGSRGRAVKEYAMAVTGRTQAVEEYVENAAALVDAASLANNNDTPSSDHQAFADFSNLGIGAPSHLMESRFGEFGGQYAPEALVDCLDEIEKVRFGCVLLQ